MVSGFIEGNNCIEFTPERTGLRRPRQRRRATRRERHERRGRRPDVEELVEDLGRRRLVERVVEEALQQERLDRQIIDVEVPEAVLPPPYAGPRPWRSTGTTAPRSTTSARPWRRSKTRYGSRGACSVARTRSQLGLSDPRDTREPLSAPARPPRHHKFIELHV